MDKEEENSKIEKKELHTEVNQQLMEEVLRRKQAEEELTASEEKYRLLVEESLDAILIIIDGKINFANSTSVKLFGVESVSELQGTCIFDYIPDDLVQHIQAMTDLLIVNKRSLPLVQERIVNRKKEEIPVEVSRSYLELNGEAAVQIIIRDITDRQKLEDKVKEALDRAMKNANMAGKAEVATSILHNVGNLLTSVIVSSSEIRGLAQSLAIDNLKKANDLLRKNWNNLEEFLIVDPKGKALLQYYLALDQKFESQREGLIENSARLRENIESISGIVSDQQSYAASGHIFLEKGTMQDLVNKCLRMQSSLFNNSVITVERDFCDVSMVEVEKNKLLHVIVNVVQNAISSLTLSSKKDKVLKLSIYEDDGHVFFRASDNGLGILKENLLRVFFHGFTTKKDGHGFGLHSCSLYMKEMMGEIWAESEGVDKGASFFLKVPLTRD
ncbi:PAS domain S-box protein [bacterium]|nr:PAS domain S-box protein [bacterium]